MKNNSWLSVTQWAKLHDKDVGNVRRLISQGRIPAQKIGSQWVIQADTLPPADKRVKSGKYIGQQKKEEKE